MVNGRLCQRPLSGRCARISGRTTQKINLRLSEYFHESSGDRLRDLSTTNAGDRKTCPFVPAEPVIFIGTSNQAGGACVLNSIFRYITGKTYKIFRLYTEF